MAKVLARFPGSPASGRRKVKEREYEVLAARLSNEDSSVILRAIQEDAEVCEAHERARRVRNEAIPEWAQGLYYNKGLFDEALVYYDEEAVYFESRGKDSGIVRFSFEMLETLKQVVEDEEEGAG
jgi:hypothetical protein